jgi:GTPase
VQVMNKIDALDPATLDALRERARNEEIDAVFVSAVTPGGLQPLADLLEERERRRRRVVEVRVPASDGRLLAELHRDAEVLEERVDESAMVVRVRVDPRMLGRLRERGLVT